MSASGIGTAAWLEIIWVAGGIVAYRYSVRNLARAKRNLQALIVSGRNGRFLLAAKHNRLEESLRVGKSVVIVAVGLVACLTPTPSPGSAPYTVVGIAVTAGLFVIAALMTVGAVASSRYYDSFERYALERRSRSTDR